MTLVDGSAARVLTNQQKAASNKNAENLNNVSLTMGEGDNKITFSVNVSSEGGGNPFSGKSEAEQQTVLAKLLFGKDNKNAEKSMKSLKANLLKLVIKSVNIEIDKYGKFTIKATSKVDPKEEDYKSLGTLVGQKAQNKENPKMSGYALEIMAEIMNMAAEARSEVIQMIIEAMEQNHIMWMEMLKQLAEKAYEDDIEEAAFIKQLMAKVDEGDVEGANAIAALLEGLGSKVILPKQIHNLANAIGAMKEKRAHDEDKKTSIDGSQNNGANVLRERAVVDIEVVDPNALIINPEGE